MKNRVFLGFCYILKNKWEMMLRPLKSDLDLLKGSYVTILSPGTLISKVVTILYMLRNC